MSRPTRPVLVAALALSLTACGDSGGSGNPEATPKQETRREPTPAEESAPVTAAASTASPARAEGPRPALTNPSLADETAPATFRVRFETTKGPFVVQVHRDWAPHGADRVWNMVRIGYFEDIAFFRAISGFMVQFGIHGDPVVNGQWRNARIPPDPVRQSNTPGRLTFAMGGSPDTRTVQLFINFVNNSRLDGMGFAPVGEVAEGMDVVNSLYTGYGEGAPRGRGPDQGLLQSQGNAYLMAQFPELDYIQSATIVE